MSKDGRHQRRHRKKPSKWRFIWIAIVTIARALAWDWFTGDGE